MQNPFNQIQQHQQAKENVQQQQAQAFQAGGQNPFAQAQQPQGGPPAGFPQYQPQPAQQAPQQYAPAPQQFAPQQAPQQFPQGFVSGPPHQGVNPPEQPSYAQIDAHQAQFNAQQGAPQQMPQGQPSQAPQQAPAAEKAKRSTRKENGVATNPETSESMGARMQIATALYAASIARGETDVDEEMGLARRAVSRASALLQALNG